jgi:hypothetical protein
MSVSALSMIPPHPVPTTNSQLDRSVDQGVRFRR